ncbi:hypothetical protein BaRGS_00032151 [Batillaria attramentaria]|uniref:Uncharacterized protein n=1 Tax=Batillaria attramentaria TaxID=370345 RepID=A0ABD0JPG7_9CAEN
MLQKWNITQGLSVDRSLLLYTEDQLFKAEVKSLVALEERKLKNLQVRRHPLLEKYCTLNFDTDGADFITTIARRLGIRAQCLKQVRIHKVEDLDLNAEPNVDIGETATDPEPEPLKTEEPDLHLAPASAEEVKKSNMAELPGSVLLCVREFGGILDNWSVKQGRHEMELHLVFKK